MKRHKVILIILVLLFAAGLIRSQASGKAQVAGNTAPSVVKKTWQEVKGWGLDEKQAVENALLKATDLVWDYLRKQDPNFVWKPDVEYVRNKLVLQDWPAQRLENHDYEVTENGKPVKWECWAVGVQITQKDFTDMMRHNDQLVLAGKQVERLTLAGKLVGLLLAGFVLALGYLRLEEKTKGYYSRLLLFGAVALLILVGGALFFFL